MLYPFLKPRKRGERNLFEFFVSWSNTTLSNILDIVRNILTGLQLSLFSGSSFLNIGVISAAFSSFENSLFLIESLMQFAKSLQISLFADLTIFVGITSLVFLVESIKLLF